MGIARALINDPEIILADEPVASLDPKTSEDIIQLLDKSARSRAATLICTLHQVDLARQFADRIIGLSAGHIVFDGTPDELTSSSIIRIYGVRNVSGEADA